MAQNTEYVNQIQASQDFFNRSTRVLEEADSNFRPTADMMTVAQQVAHAAQTLEWFVQGATRPEGFDLNFEEHAKEIAATTSLTEARKWMDKSYAAVLNFLATTTPEALAAPLPEGPVMGGQPVSSIINGIVDHTAHHRGALTVYSRQIGKVPVMPYGG